jgi:hypothetical protein
VSPCAPRPINSRDGAPSLCAKRAAGPLPAVEAEPLLELELLPLELLELELDEELLLELDLLPELELLLELELVLELELELELLLELLPLELLLKPPG